MRRIFPFLRSLGRIYIYSFILLAFFKKRYFLVKIYPSISCFLLSGQFGRESPFIFLLLKISPALSEESIVSFLHPFLLCVQLLSIRSSVRICHQLISLCITLLRFNSKIRLLLSVFCVRVTV